MISSVQFNKIEFSIFCIENIAIKLKRNASDIYNLLVRSNILESYINANYDMLHTQSKDYIVDDIIELMKEKGVSM